MQGRADVLGEEGRKVRDACVKVKIVGKLEDKRRYTWQDAVERLNKCYARESRVGSDGCCYSVPLFDCLFPDPDKYYFGVRGQWYIYKKYGGKTYDILDIHDALEKVDEKPFVEKYTSLQRPGHDELNKLIDKRRADIEIECKEALANPDARHKYSWLVAQRRVRSCFGGHFRDDFQALLGKSSHFDGLYSIIDIYKAVCEWKIADWEKFKKFTDEEGPGAYEQKVLVEEHISALEKEYQDAKRSLKQYSEDEAEKRVTDCSPDDPLLGNSKFSILKGGRCDGNIYKTYTIFDIHNRLNRLYNLSQIEFSSQLKKDVCRSVIKEYESAINNLCWYPRSEAERRVRDCLRGNFVGDTDIFPNKDEELHGPKTEQTYDIFDIKHSIEYFDERKFLKKCVDKNDPMSKENREITNHLINEERKKINEEYAKAIEKVEIEHGSGFIINDHFVITNKHVIDDAEDKTIFICNASIGELSCKVAYTDIKKDLALLYCQGLDIKQNRVAPLRLSNEPLLPGMQVFSFGYPMSHTGETALFVNGHVSGYKETYSDYRPSLVVLNLSLNSGNSGGPILSWIGNQLKVVGVTVQKHFKEILTLEEREKIEQIRKSMETNYISDISDREITCLRDQVISPHSVVPVFATSEPDPRQIPMNLLTLKLYDALETHSQFNLSNAVRGGNVIKFIEEAFKECERKHKDELDEVVKWSADRNILPSGQHSASDCSIQ